jgi:hypothetical protein
MPSKVFSTYRRDDAGHAAGRVLDRLEREFGRVHGRGRFMQVLRDEVARCDVLLALIGPNWLDVRDEQGNRRLDNPEDFLRIEIATALQRDIPVIPILLDGARMPKAYELPNDLKELSVRNGIEVRHASFRSDMDNLIRGLRGALGAGRATPLVVDAEGRIAIRAPSTSSTAAKRSSTNNCDRSCVVPSYPTAARRGPFVRSGSKITDRT